MKLLIAFTDQSKSFTNGVELGRLLEKMQRGDQNIDNCGFPVHIENRQVIEATCKQYGYIASFGQEHYDQWVEFIGIKKTSSDN